MNLNSEDIYNNIESFKNKHNYTLEKMAEFTGMHDKSAYSGMIKKRRMKLEYLINLINNTEITLEQIFKSSTKSQHYNNDEDLQVVEDGCEKCRLKEIEINRLKGELLITQNKYIHLLETGSIKKENASTNNQKAG